MRILTIFLAAIDWPFKQELSSLQTVKRSIFSDRGVYRKSSLYPWPEEKGYLFSPRPSVMQLEMVVSQSLPALPGPLYYPIPP